MYARYRASRPVISTSGRSCSWLNMKCQTKMFCSAGTKIEGAGASPGITASVSTSFSTAWGKSLASAYATHMPTSWPTTA
ncbi:hypothetical protein D3C84_1075690 [compost metagenome]